MGNDLLRAMLGGLPADLAAAVVVVFHIPRAGTRDDGTAGMAAIASRGCAAKDALYPAMPTSEQHRARCAIADEDVR
jgi:hypothetical protein